jgi:hypothetical protein
MSGTAVLERTNVRPDGTGHIVLPDGTRWEIPPHPLSGRIQPATELIPRVCMVPDYAYSSGPEAIEMAASAGLDLDPWEQLALILGLGETAEGKWAAFQVALIVARQNGKGAILEALGLWWLFGTGELLIGHTAHEYKTAMEAFRRILSLIENTDWMRRKVKKIINTNGEEGIELLPVRKVITGEGSQAGGQTGGQRMRFLARSKGAGRGFTFRKLVWDEAYALTEEQQEAQLPTMSAVPNPQVWLTSSPPLTSDTGKPLFKARRGAGGPGSTFMDYGAPGSLDKLEEIDLDSVALALAANPNAPERISEEAMARERVAMGDRGYARERLCIWPPDLEQGFTVISAEQWQAMEDARSGSDEWPAPDSMLPHDAAMFSLELGMNVGRKPPTALVGRPCISPDVRPRIGGTVPASIGLASRREDGKVHIELLRSGAGTAWLVGSLVSVHVTTGAVIVLDPGSPAGSILADLQTALRDHYKEPEKDLSEILYLMAARDVAQAFGMIYDAATSPLSEPRTIVHLPQKELALAVGGADSRPVGSTGGYAWDQRTATVDITGLVAVTNATWGLAKMPAETETEPMVVWA